MTEANRLTHYGLLVTVFLRVNTILRVVVCVAVVLLVTAFLRANTIVVISLFVVCWLLVTAFLRVSN